LSCDRRKEKSQQGSKLSPWKDQNGLTGTTQVDTDKTNEKLLR